MRIKEGFVLRSIADNYMIVAEGIEQIDFNKVVSLNETAAELWKAVQGQVFSKDDLCKLLLNMFPGAVDEATAAADASALADKWVEAGLVEE